MRHPSSSEVLILRVDIWRSRQIGIQLEEETRIYTEKYSLSPPDQSSTLASSL